MTERNLLGILESTLETIRDQSFKSPQHEAKVKRIHHRVTFELFDRGQEQKVRETRFNVNTKHETRVPSLN